MLTYARGCSPSSRISVPVCSTVLGVGGLGGGQKGKGRGGREALEEGEGRPEREWSSTLGAPRLGPGRGRKRDWGDRTRHVVPSALARLPSPCGVRRRRCPRGRKFCGGQADTQGAVGPQSRAAPLALAGDTDQPGGPRAEGPGPARQTAPPGASLRPTPRPPATPRTHFLSDEPRKPPRASSPPAPQGLAGAAAPPGPSRPGQTPDPSGTVPRTLVFSVS